MAKFIKMAKNVKTVKNEKMKKSLQKKIKKGFIAVARLTLKPGASLARKS